MANEFRTAQDLMGAIDGILALPDSLFSAQTGRDMLKTVAEQIDIVAMAKTQQQEFLRENLSYTQVVMLCTEMNKEIQDLMDSIEDIKDVISEKKVFFKQIFAKFLDLPELILTDYPRYDAEILIELCHPNAKLPTYAHENDAGADVYAVDNCVILPKTTVVLPTGLKMVIPKGWMISARPRSGLSLKTNFRIPNSPGTVDSQYLSEVGVLAYNTGETNITITAGDRIAQFILERAYKAEFTLTDDVTKHSGNRANANGEQGLGSTDAPQVE